MEFLALEIFSISLIGVCTLLIYVCKVLVLKPRGIRLQLQKQGISGPPPSFILGNIQEMKTIQTTVGEAFIGQHVSHDYSSRIFPYFEVWKKEYGPIFMYSTGNIQHLCVIDPVMAKEICLNTSLDFGKPTFVHKASEPLLGKSILTANGTKWAHQRKVIAPQLYMDKIKGMVSLMVDLTTSLVRTWESRIESEGEIGEVKVDEDLRCLSADIISKACFGSSYSKGKEIFQKLKVLQNFVSKRGLRVGIPGLRYLPTKNNRESWKLKKEIDSLILKVVKERRETKSENDLLQSILEGANNDDEVRLDSIDSFIVDNCKGIYFAGSESTATSASWILMLLASNPEWQIRVRNEVVEVCGGSLPDATMLPKMKTLTMVVLEALRLYPPAPFLLREALEPIKLNALNIPKGVNVWCPIANLQQDPEVWGPEASVFNPDRFSHGIAKACKIPQVFMPFGAAPRTCVGQNFAMVELKIVTSVILSKFSFTLSPNYRHSPVLNLVMQPKHGVHLLMKKL